jgi:hypothetical protein
MLRDNLAGLIERSTHTCSHQTKEQTITIEFTNGQMFGQSKHDQLRMTSRGGLGTWTQGMRG